MQGEVPSSRHGRVVSLVALALAIAGGLSVLALRPVFASASPRVATGTSDATSSLRAPATSLARSLGATAAARWAARAPAADAAGGPVSPEPVTHEAAGPEPPAFLTARVTEGTALLRTRPRARVVAEVGPTSEFGSPTTLGVVERRGPWLGVVSAELENGEVGWIDLREGGVALASTRISLVLDLSRRQLVVRRDDEVLRRMTVGVGAPGSPTPTGRFAVTDKLDGASFSPVYGCCVIALSARQPNLPAGWQGGDRIAVHGTDDPASIGKAVSAGCPHASDADLRFLMRRVPLGTPVFIHP